MPIGVAQTNCKSERLAGVLHRDQIFCFIAVKDKIAIIKAFFN